jgi:putative nucleotidyltransferase with HDIG domain/PAS domain S-box-containing protein
MSEPLRVLLVEDSPVDAELNERELRRAGLLLVTRRVDREKTLVAALADFCPDLILADYHLPGFDGLRALAICHERAPVTPFIFVTGAMGEELAVESIQRGATDYILKDRLARLPAAAQRALAERRTLLERTQAQADLRASEERYHQLFEAMSSGVAIYRPDATGTSFTIQAVNRAVERIEGVARQDLLGRDVEGVFPGIAAMGLLAVLRRVAHSGEPERVSVALYQDSRISGWRENFVYRLGSGEVVAVYEDVTERMVREARIDRLNRTLRTITACNQDLVRTRCEGDLLQAVSHDLVQVGQHLLVWVAYPDSEGSDVLKTIISWGEPGVLRALGEVDLGAVQAGFGLTRAALDQGRTLIWTKEVPIAEGLPPAILGAGVAAGVALPLIHDGKVLGILTVLAGSPAAFDGEEVALLEELAADLAHGIVAIRTALERNRYLHQVGQSMRGTVAVLARAAEMRDPYTAGHQQRVAALAVAIAQDLGLSEHLIEGLYLGGMIHDIGKIAVPAEILNKPTRLTGIEYQLIQQHAQLGHQIVAGIDFPWPLAAMIVQHHERLDGSGYPYGLRGEAMLQESRILAVADVVEAMSSHRPYRAALGMQAALEEIEQGRGSRFDPAVVDACVRVIHAGGMRLPASPTLPISG